MGDRYRLSHKPMKFKVREENRMKRLYILLFSLIVTTLIISAVLGVDVHALDTPTETQKELLEEVGTALESAPALTQSQAGAEEIGQSLPAADNIIYVTTTVDEYNPSGPGAGCSLREAITAATTSNPYGGCVGSGGHEIINLPAGTYNLTRQGSGEDDNVTGDLDFDSFITLQGAGSGSTIIDASQLNDRAIDITNFGGTCAISGVTIRGGTSSSDGGGVKVWADLTITDSVISNSTTTGSGGGIYNTRSLILDNVTVTDNQADTDGGGIYSWGTLTLQNGSTVQDNEATGLGGGIVNYSYVQQGRATLVNATVSGNEASLDGGGLYSEGILSLNASSITGNTANNGGGIYNDRFAQSLTIENGTQVFNNTAADKGGGLYNDESTVTINDSIVGSSNPGEGNQATDGGGIYDYEGTITLHTTAELIGNSATGSGGGIYNDMGTWLLQEGSKVWGNDAVSDGGGIYNHGALTITESVVGADEAAEGNHANRGGGIYNHLDSSMSLLNGSEVKGNDVDSDGGGIYNHGALTIIDSVVGADETGGGNHADRGGGVYIHLESSMSLLNGSEVKGNDADENGGGIYNEGVLTLESGSSIYKNEAGFGGGIFNTSVFSMTNSTLGAGDTVDGNSAVKGGGLYNEQLASATIQSDAEVLGNSADEHGGGIYNRGTLHLVDASLSDNMVCCAAITSRGAGLYNSFATATISNTVVSGNWATDSGGGVYSHGGAMTIYGSPLMNNTSEGADGGALYSVGTNLKVKSSAIVGNSAKFSGGGIAFLGGTLTLHNTTLSDNTSKKGGGLNVSSGTANINFSTIAHNAADGSHGPWGSNIDGTGGTVNTYASVITNPEATPPIWDDPTNCRAAYKINSTGYNRFSDDSCLDVLAQGDLVDANITLVPLADNGGPTPTYLLWPDTDSGVDIIPASECQQAFVDLGEIREDQRGKPRPQAGLLDQWQPGDPLLCDAGAVELGDETHYVCGPHMGGRVPLGGDAWTWEPARYSHRCEYETISAALQQAVTGNTIVVSGVLSETVEMDYNMTFRGPNEEDGYIEPGTHMGVVQPGATKPVGGGYTSDPVFDIAQGAEITIKGLNLRHGNNAQGGAINNAGILYLEESTLYDNRADQGAAVFNSGAVYITNSTLVGNNATSGSGIYNGSSGVAEITHSTLTDNVGGNIYSDATATVYSSILSAADANPQCTGTVNSGGHNLVEGSTCFAAADPDDLTDDPALGPLRDNGGPTLTKASAKDSPVIDAGLPAPNCAVEIDQRGRARPYADACDIGAVEYGTLTLTVCQNCEADPEALRFDDLQEALNWALAGDTVAVEAGAYTGNFVAYKDGAIGHAGVDVATMDHSQNYDVRAILQSSEKSVADQHANLDHEQNNEDLSGSVIMVQAFAYPPGASNPVVATDDVSVGMQDLTIRHGLAREGGGIYNLGHLDISTTTIEDNAAVNQNGAVTEDAKGGGIFNAGCLTLNRSTISGNQSEYYGGGLYNALSGAATCTGEVRIHASTIADNKAVPIGRQHIVTITSQGTSLGFTLPDGLSLTSGDYIQFMRTRDAASINDLTVEIIGITGGQCNAAVDGSIAVPPFGSNLSEPLTCTANQNEDVVVSVRLSDQTGSNEDFTFYGLSFVPEADTIYTLSDGSVTLSNSILASSDAGVGNNCRLVAPGLSTGISSKGYNLATDPSCELYSDGDSQNEVIDLGPLQDNNSVDYQYNLISGYTHSRALKPDSHAIDHIPLESCTDVNDQPVATWHVIDLDSSYYNSVTIEPSDIITWTLSVSGTIALEDGEANIRLINIGADGISEPVQFNEAGDVSYRVYDESDFTEIGAGVVHVGSSSQAKDQRGVTLPQLGSKRLYNCDSGAYEFRPWRVGLPFARPPIAIGTQPPRVLLDNASVDSIDPPYHTWSPATAQDFPLRPSPNDNDKDIEPKETISLIWDMDPDPVSQEVITQYGVIEWPVAPQLHVSAAGVSVIHSDIVNGFTLSDARAFEGRIPADEATERLITNGIFNRLKSKNAVATPYSVLQWVKGTQSNMSREVQAVKTVDWSIAGILDVRDAHSECLIGTEIGYEPFQDASGMLSGHEDPEGRSGQILNGMAFDGVAKTDDMAWAKNTVNALVPPAHVQETREGPIIPILDEVPGLNPTEAGHDLEIAWYRPDSRNVAWPVKTVGYQCEWPVDPPKIVVASELGSEIDEQPIFESDSYSDLTVYHQPDPSLPGLNPNDEHALVATSNMETLAPALYALRTDLAKQPYALLKYRDPKEDGLIKLAVYEVLLTKSAETITGVITEPGAVTLQSNLPGAQTSEAVALVPSQSNTIIRIDDGTLVSGGEVILPLRVINARHVRNVSLLVTYDATKLTPMDCDTNRADFTEELHSLQVVTDSPQRPARVIHMRADVVSGTDAVYEWDFGDGSIRISGNEVSHVYGADGTYNVTVTASNGAFGPVTDTEPVQISSASPGTLIEDTTDGCRVESPGQLRITMQARDKHGLSGELRLSDLTFAAEPGFIPSETTQIGLSDITLWGPGYEDLSFSLTAGIPVDAPVPLRGILDIHPCEQTQAADIAARPFWKDYRGMIWARAAGDMQVLYFYPLQPGFHVTEDHANDLGLTDDNGAVLSEEDRVGYCVPWLDKLPNGTLPYPDYPESGTTTQVFPVNYHADWPDLPPLLSVGETVYERAKSGISGVANQLAVTRIYDDLAPGAWDSNTQGIIVEGLEVQTSLAQVIDPISDVRVELLIVINDNPSLPEEIKTERLLFGGGQAIIGNKSNPSLALPFSLRSRITFDETPRDLDGDGEATVRWFFEATTTAHLKSTSRAIHCYC